MRAFMVCFIFAGFCFGVAFGAATQGMDNHAEAIKHNCAQYNSQTGDFEWKNKQ